MYAELSIQREDDVDVRQVVLLLGQTRIIGRSGSSGANLRLDAKDLSRVHATVELRQANRCGQAGDPGADDDRVVAHFGGRPARSVRPKPRSGETCLRGGGTGS